MKSRASRRACTVAAAFATLSLLLGCTASPHGAPTAGPSATIAATAPAAATATATIVPQTATAVSTGIAAGVTPRLWTSDTPTPIHRPTHYDLPDWLDDPDAPVLMAKVYHKLGGAAPITFINVASGQRSEFTPLGNSDDPQWGRDGQGAYFEYSVSESVGNVSHVAWIDRVRLATGDVIRLPADEVGMYRPIASPTGTRIAQISGEPGSMTISLENSSTGESTLLDDSFHGSYSDAIDARWSPVGELLVVLRYRFTSESYAPPATGLTIYSSDGRIYRRYKDVRGLNWAPDSSLRILLPYDESGPCALDVKSNKVQCFDDISAWLKRHGLEGGGFDWVPSGNRLGFIVWNAWDDASRGTSTGASLCLYSVESGNIVCPIGNDVVGLEHFIIDYSWSPDGQYLWLIVDATDPRSDDRTQAQVATVSSDGRNFQLWGGYTPYDVSWRPPNQLP